MSFHATKNLCLAICQYRPCINHRISYKIIVYCYSNDLNLGNKTYEHFNAMGRFCDKKLEELGGQRIHTLGEGKDIFFNILQN